jgi:hypothetical protein
MSEGPFTQEWVAKHMVPKERLAKPLDDVGCIRIATALNQAYAAEVLKNERLKKAAYVPHPSNPQVAWAQLRGFHIGAPGGWSHGDEAFQKQRRWHSYAPDLARVAHTELSRVQTHSLVDIGFSKDGPIARMLKDAAPIITGEHPSRSAIAKKLERL